VRAAPHPDPEKGVFETMLVIDGRPVELGAHLHRLSSSLATVFGAAPPRRARKAILAAARRVRHGKLRITIAPIGKRRTRMSISTAEIERPLIFPSAEHAVALRSFAVEGGLGTHKWADRSLLEHAAASSAGELPLLLSRDGAVLEASRGSVFLVRDGSLQTPATDGRILPGIARRRVIEVAHATGVEAREGRLTLDDLLRSDEVFLAGSVRGVEPVRSVDGAEIPVAGEVSRRVAAALRRRWLRVPEAGRAATVAVGRRGDRPAR
jgi:para-aminobenzoate synthetase/4-amino-4-deoxychorismate lyase